MSYKQARGIFNPDNEPVEPAEETINRLRSIPLCWCCGEPMEETGEREIYLDGGFITAFEPIYECSNPYCDDCEDDE